MHIISHIICASGDKYFNKLRIDSTFAFLEGTKQVVEPEGICNCIWHNSIQTGRIYLFGRQIQLPDKGRGRLVPHRGFHHVNLSRGLHKFASLNIACRAVVEYRCNSLGHHDLFLYISQSSFVQIVLESSESPGLFGILDQMFQEHNILKLV